LVIDDREKVEPYFRSLLSQGISKLRPAKPFHPVRRDILSMMKKIMLKKNCEMCLWKICWFGRI